MKDFSYEREKMVSEQILSRRVFDKRVIDAMRKVPRHEFVPESVRNLAYDDRALPTMLGQTISQPYIVALMTEALKLKGSEKVLEIGTGSGYQTAILCELASIVYTIERYEQLTDMAKATLNSLQYSNVYFATCDGTKGWKEFAPYDRIIVTASAPDITAPLVEQLNDPGIMVIPVAGGTYQNLTVLTKDKADIHTTVICGCVFVPLVGEYGWKNDD